MSLLKTFYSCLLFNIIIAVTVYLIYLFIYFVYILYHFFIFLSIMIFFIKLYNPLKQKP